MGRAEEMESNNAKMNYLYGRGESPSVVEGLVMVLARTMAEAQFLKCATAECIYQLYIRNNV